MLRRTRSSTDPDEAHSTPEAAAAGELPDAAADDATAERLEKLATELGEVRDNYAREIIELRARLRGVEHRLRRLERTPDEGAPGESGIPGAGSADARRDDRATRKAAKRERKTREGMRPPATGGP